MNYRGAVKSLARPGRKQATATKLWFLQATQKQFRRLSVQPGLRGSNDLRVGRKMAIFQLFFQSGRAKDLSAPLYIIQRTVKLILRVLLSRRFAQILTLLTCISEVLGSNIGGDINYSHWGYLCFPQSAKAIFRYSISMIRRSFPSISFPFIVHRTSETWNRQMN